MRHLLRCGIGVLAVMLAVADARADTFGSVPSCR